MQLEVGDYFVITRGAKMHPTLMGAAAQLGVELPVFHDPTWSGIVLQAHEVQGTLVAAEIVGRSAGSPDAPCRVLGTRHVIDIAKVRWEPVSKRFAMLLSLPAAPVPAAVGPAHGCADERDQT